jgi:hypothetical protein
MPRIHRDYELTYSYPGHAAESGHMVDAGGLKIYQSILRPQWHPVHTQFITDKTQMEFYFVFPGTNSQYDRIKDANILLDVNPAFNPFYTSVENFTNKIIQVLTDFSAANGGVGTTQNIPVILVSHSLGSHIASKVRYNLIQHGIGLEYGLIYEAFCPFVWKDTAYAQELASATARQAEIVGTNHVNQYTANYNIYAVEGDVVSLNVKTLAYGHAYYRPAKPGAGFMGSLAHFTGVAEANTPANHKINNWVDTTNGGALRPTALTNTPLTVLDSHFNVTHVIDTGNWVLSSRRAVNHNGSNVHLNLESHANGLYANIHKADTEQDADHPTYRWTITKQDHIIGYSSSTNEHEHRYITELWRLQNVNNNDTIYVYFKKDYATTYPSQGANSSANRFFWLMEDAITGNLYQVTDDANLSGATLGTDGQIVVNVNPVAAYRAALQGSSVTLFKTYEWSFEAEAAVHRVADWAEVQQMAPGDVRRVLIDDSGTAYNPIVYVNPLTFTDALYANNNKYIGIECNGKYLKWDPPNASHWLGGSTNGLVPHPEVEFVDTFDATSADYKFKVIQLDGTPYGYPNTTRIFFEHSTLLGTGNNPLSLAYKYGMQASNSGSHWGGFGFVPSSDGTSHLLGVRDNMQTTIDLDLVQFGQNPSTMIDTDGTTMVAFINSGHNGQAGYVHFPGGNNSPGGQDIANTRFKFIEIN